MARNKGDRNADKNETNYWHPAFCSAMKLDLNANKHDLSFEVEHELNRRPIKVDLLIIKKSPYIQVKNEIGRIFRGHNIFEYKSPKDEMNCDTFSKSVGYASLYKAYGKKVDEIRIDDVTLSLVRESKPEGLFRWFDENGIRYEKKYEGIYYVEYLKPVKIQIVVGRELKDEGHIWLKALTENLTKAHAGCMINDIGNFTEKDDKESVYSVMQVVMDSNKRIFCGEDEKMYIEKMIERLQPDIDRMIAEKVAEGVAERDKAIAEQAALIKELQMKIAVLQENKG